MNFDPSGSLQCSHCWGLTWTIPYGPFLLIVTDFCLGLGAGKTALRVSERQQRHFMLEICGVQLASPPIRCTALPEQGQHVHIAINCVWQELYKQRRSHADGTCKSPWLWWRASMRARSRCVVMRAPLRYGRNPTRWPEIQ